MYDPTSLPIRVLSSVFRVFGLGITIWRIYFRLKIHRFWWEDACAAVALLSCLASLVGEWTNLLTNDLSSIVGWWVYALGAASVTRSVHLSILLSIIRILPAARLHRLTQFYVACCVAFWAVAVSGKIWRCVSDPSWHHREPPGCNVGSQLAIFEFSTDCSTVVILIVIPVCVLWRVKLPRRQRRMILSIFASSVVLAITAVFHIVGDILMIDIIKVAGDDFENACSIIVCNLLVVVTYAYRFLRRDSDGSNGTTMAETDSDDFTQPRGQTTRLPMSLTTVEIDSCLTQQLYTPDLSTQSHSV